MIDMQLLAARDECVRTMQSAQTDLAQRYGSVFPQEVLVALDILSQSFAKEISDMWRTEEFVAIFASDYGLDMSDEDIDQILAHYTSVVGQKDVRAAKTAIATTMGQMLRIRKDRFDPAFRDYNAHVEKILAALDPLDD